ncbi:TetR family transcriptional regulator [Streptomyces sp. NPDC017993]|uniref:TetR family transcriptional regulator n=1 Tax=Streptomyces sp. NPDC017993 TaxID=3365027 RepID=UPI0037A4F5FE
MDTVAFLAYLDGRQTRWRLVLDDCIDDAGEDPRARLLAVFDALKEWATSPSGFRSCAFVHAQVELAPPEHPGRRVVARQKRAVRDRVRELAEATGTPDPDLLADQLLLLYEGVIAQYTVGTVENAADRAHATARQLIAAATPHPLDAFWAGPRTV